MENHIISVSAKSRGTTLTHVTARQHTFQIDEPEFFGGRDLAPSPVDYLLGSVAGCVTAIGCLIAKEQGFTMHQLDTKVDGRINSACFLGLPDAARSWFQEITVSLEIDCDATEEQLQAWKDQLAVRCPVLDGLLHPTELKIECKRNCQ